MAERPTILFLELPREQQSVGGLLYQLLAMLEFSITEAGDSVELFEWAHARRELRWSMIGMKYCAIAISNFHEVKATIRNKILPRCADLEALVDYTAYDAADALFDRFFPSAREFRTVIAHPGRIYRNPEEHAKNTCAGSIFHFNYVNGAATVVMGNQTHHLAVTKQVVANLEEVKHLIWSALEDASQFTLRLRDERIARGGPLPRLD